MQNIINFDVRGDYTCSCMCAIHNKSESIDLFFEADSYNTPQLEISIIGETKTTTVYDLEVVNGFAVYNFDHRMFSTDQTVSIKYIDGLKSGTEFYFRKSYETYGYHTTMRVDKISDIEFKINIVRDYKVDDFSDDFEEVNGELKLRSPIEINVTKQNDKVINVRIVYKKPTETEPGDEKSYNCTYNADGNLTRFGDLPIVWNGG